MTDLVLYESVPETADTFILRRVRPTVEGTFGGIYDFRFMPDFGGGAMHLLVGVLARLVRRSLDGEGGIVTTSIAGIPELVDGQCGWLAPSGSVEDFAQAMIAVLKADSATLARMASCGRERVLQYHEAGANAESLLGHIRAFPAAAA